jgi:ABC-2 type transport system ATP-binding protein
MLSLQSASRLKHEIAAQPEVALELVSLCKSFSGRPALRGVSLVVLAGERVALLGPNGAGKTTLVRSISGRVRLDSGSVSLFDVPVRQPRALDKLGVVPQELAIYGDLTAEENLRVFGRMHGLRGNYLREQVEWALEWIGLADRRYHLARTFSGGMKRRINIACGVLHQPRLLLLDEPTVGVDPQSRQRIFDMLNQLHQLGTTLMLTTHHLDEAQTQCDRIVIVDHGKIIADGALEKLIEETLGQRRRVTLRISGWSHSPLPEVQWDAPTESWKADLQDIVADLPALLHSIGQHGGSVSHLEIREPNLHEVFLQLTGSELRE